MKIRTRTNRATASSFQIINYCLFLLMFRHQTVVMEDTVINLGVISRCSHKHWIRILASCLWKLAAKNSFFFFWVVTFIAAIDQLWIDHQSLYKNWLFMLCSAVTDCLCFCYKKVASYSINFSVPYLSHGSQKGKIVFFLTEMPIKVTGELSEIICKIS